MQATPATWRLMMDAGWTGGSRLKVLCGGESMGRELANQLLERGGEVWNLYGPTETTIWSTVERVSPGAGVVSVGRPIWNTEILVLDANLQPVPVGVPAEMFIGGDGLARGYFNRPELDAEKFVPHPFANLPAARLYRTGDLGRFLPDGRIECLGRSDNQVKLRGFRIELGEIESVLGQHEAVAQAVASVFDDIAAGRRLVAYVSFRDGAEATPSELRRFARQHLPEYMVPSLFAVLDEIPLTPNGKVNRKALPAPVAHSRAPVERIAPRTDMERLVAAVWKDVLGIKDVGIHDNFFDVGGHSLLSIQAIVRLEKQVGVRLNPARLIMDNLEQISAACEGMVAAVAAKSDSGLAHMPQTPGAGA